ncbi:thioredoxin-dependent thiol peroxidase [Persicimonas caeni]|uniref:thioredoxin-dependent peroxiredoxin n=1 Tax=Persicimonas caeni TaxID=2292766 RepID=A0A4Y6PUT8_PERCE|nr:thioredoxin-dependent thiol peroxidase [Persicimonas caeni]QDG51869.1 thioredoxin-dependent thiol peroxidase [Persicimonas caeni]QED33090.1 thioredoxin-dependent thiol peroxidase [Persicimonas caeni]
MGTNPVLKVGDEAPDFTLDSDDAGEVSLSDLRGQKVVLYFYPKDMTPGCTTQACDFRDNMDTFEDKGFKVLGVSPDPVERHEKFRDKHDLNFTLLADPDHQVAEAYGVWREKKNYGKTYTGIVRSTFFIDEEGKIAEIQDNVRAKGHVDRLLRDSV